MQARRRWRLLSKGLFILAGFVFVWLTFLRITRNDSDETTVWFSPLGILVLAGGGIKFYVLGDDIHIRGERPRFGRLTREPPPKD